MISITSRMSSLLIKPGVVSSLSSSFSTTPTANLTAKDFPKQPLNGYMSFAAQIRPQVQKENPGLKVSEVAKIIGEKYKNLPEAKKDELKKNYEVKKEAYLQAVEKFKASPGGDEIFEQMKKDKKVAASKRDKIRYARLQNDLGKPKKPPGPFIDFCRAKGKMGSNVNLTEMAKAMAEEWKGLSDAEKAPYQEKSKLAFEKYQVELKAWTENQDPEKLEKIKQLKRKSKVN